MACDTRGIGLAVQSNRVLWSFGEQTMTGVKVGEPQGGHVFVTVGTTLFDALIQAVDTPAFKRILLDKGYSNLVIQYGKGRIHPKEGVFEDGGRALRVEAFTFKPSLADYVKNAGLVISHAGSGSIFETLRAKRPLVVVVNELLMDNHQQELADALADNRFLVVAKPSNLPERVGQFDQSSLVEYPKADAGNFAVELDRLVGFAP
ncbi:beta-1,4-N-acetylglucosaminyltransferase [Klebsormidium nitens]|uniref:Beta-1,4-N-acetylglucosaminyltransferase n=1 Tax=Klebsormidium nitens TaxID=105231 RepID=A0A1Y1HI24_KLENI|nr:beta-1,4-N-acetylglucosaminyltransferase [Klebsormidium nitens]|eukprot:GAQ78100.1 beta-1,4-N-acetylglucosaminyltransferase [Klebsormidium nitens]